MSTQDARDRLTDQTRPQIATITSWSRNNEPISGTIDSAIASLRCQDCSKSSVPEIMRITTPLLGFLKTVQTIGNSTGVDANLYVEPSTP